MTTFIDSTANPKIKHTVKIASSSKYRKECGEFFLEGLRLCFDAAISNAEVKSVFFTEKADEKNPDLICQIKSRARESYLISDAVCSKIAQTQNSQGVFCICAVPKEEHGENFSVGAKYVALDNIQNPDNLGAISRTAEAFGIDALIVGGGCDIYNPKALRASMGSLIRLPVIKTDDLLSSLAKLSADGFKLFATTPDADAQNITTADMSGSSVCVIGNEANGVSDEVFALCRKVTIPMSGRAESLNASMAAAVTMWEMVREKSK